MDINRRSLLKSMGVASLGVTAQPFLKGERLAHPQIEQKKIETDIVVVGGGTAGVIAAIQAGRMGKNVVLVECASQLGGTTTTGGVNFPGIFFAWGKQVIGGIGWELVKDAVEMNDDELPDFSQPHGRQHWRHQVRVNGQLYAILAEEKCLEAGVQIRFYESPTHLEFDGKKWVMETVGKGIKATITAKQVIDCSGNAYAAQLAGYEVLREEEIQPGTLNFRIDGYDLESIDTKALQEAYLKKVENGELVREHFRGNIVALLRSKGDNIQHIMDADSTTSESHSIANIEGRQSLLHHLRFLRQFPGLEKTRIVDVQNETAVRETYRINGLYKITHEDYVTGRMFPDAVSYSYYPIDLHDAHGVIPKHLEDNVVAKIPLRALIPRGSTNFMVAGRCLSSDRLANSALRVQASCMGMGQVAGVATSMAISKNTTPANLDFDELVATLRSHGAIVPG